ncbi:hypothetical protein [Glycomyces tenuis]|uniref:hypothetical protein n=1 Tax=Glycomyces tenuis TaxID=58116 RepID=UPI000411219A|nr:hypothetical protein [Glycomyces tenuis]
MTDQATTRPDRRIAELEAINDQLRWNLRDAEKGHTALWGLIDAARRALIDNARSYPPSSEGHGAARAALFDFLHAVEDKHYGAARRRSINAAWAYVDRLIGGVR